MNIRRIVAAVGLCVSVLAAGCASTVAGQAQVASGAALPTTSQSAPTPFPDPSSDGSSTGESSSSDTSSSESTGGETSSESTGEDPTSESAPTSLTENTPTVTGSSDPEDTSERPTSVTSIPGLSKDCSAVLTGITAFGTVLQSSGSSDTISQATVDQVLRQLPESGLPARPQADITTLRTVVSGAAGKTVSELAVSLVDGNVVTALKDLSSWAQDNCS